MLFRLLLLFLLSVGVLQSAPNMDSLLKKKIENIYKTRDFTPVWIDELAIDESVFYFIDYILGHNEFLTEIEIEYVKNFKKRLNELDFDSSQDFAVTDIDITRFFLKYSYILYFGGNRYENFAIKGFEVKAKKKKNDYEVKGFKRSDENKFLKKAISHLKVLDQLPSFIDRLVPTSKEYKKLKDVRKIYEDIEEVGGFVTISIGKKLALGSSGKRVKSLYYRLLQTNDITERKNDEELEKFDEIVHEGVLHFQKRFNLKPDGIVGKNTIAILNIPATKRLRDIDINLRRWHFLSRDFDNDYIIVNIPEFRLRFMKDDEELVTHKVIVGKHDHPTPVFTENMKYVVVNPYWRVPQSIVIKEFVEKIQENIDYLDTQNIAIYTNSQLKGKPIDPYEIDWDNFDKSTLKSTGYKFIQKSGDANALGRVKFLFPNRHSVYLHDTPTKHLFKQTQRSYSHGCVRLHNPLDFAKYILNERDERNEELDLDMMVDSEKNQTITLKNPIPIHLVYLTAFVDDNGVNFRNDMYELDKKYEDIKNVYNRNFKTVDEKIVLADEKL